MADRVCGDCSMCCKLYDIPELDKKAGAWCRHCAPGRGCTAYEARPGHCRSFQCLWIQDPTMPEFWKPNRARMVPLVRPETGHVFVTVDPEAPLAWRREPYHAALRAWSARLAAADVRLIVTIRRDAYLILPDADVPLGETSPEKGFKVTRRMGPSGFLYEVVPDATR